jgi:hypothetical protein
MQGVVIMSKYLNQNDRELVNLNISKKETLTNNCANPDTKAIYFGEIGKQGEFQGGLMEDEATYAKLENPIITSKEDVMKRISSNKIKSRSNTDAEVNQACNNCILQ